MSPEEQQPELSGGDVIWLETLMQTLSRSLHDGGGKWMEGVDLHEM